MKLKRYLLLIFIILFSVQLSNITSIKATSPQFSINPWMPYSTIYKGNFDEAEVAFIINGLGNIDYGEIVVTSDSNNFITNSYILGQNIETYNYTSDKFYTQTIEIFNNTKIPRNLLPQWSIIIHPVEQTYPSSHYIAGKFNIDIKNTNPGLHHLFITLFITSNGEHYKFEKEIEYTVYNWLDQYLPILNLIFSFIGGGIVSALITKIYNDKKQIKNTPVINTDEEYIEE